LTGPLPTFDRGEHWDVDSDDDDVADLTDGATGVITAAAVSDAGAEKKVRTATSPAATVAQLTATAATATQLRRLASERTTEQKGKGRRKHDDDDPDGANERVPGPGKDGLRLRRSRCLCCFGHTAEGGYGRTSGSDGGYGRTVEAAANGGRVFPAHDATQSRRPRRCRPTAARCPVAVPDDSS